ncbi:MAG: type II toxin-antitoxin system MqsA family antitoxin [Candidatus Paceibacterota bacterium]
MIADTIIPVSQDGNWKEGKVVHAAAARRSRCATPKTEIQPKEIAAIRRQLNVSQAVFAAYLGVRSASVMSWEYGTRRPSGAALKLLSIIRQNPSLLIAA